MVEGETFVGMDNDGFMTREKQWTKDLAEFLARENKIVEGKLSDDHWKIITFIREFYLNCDRGPSIVRIGRATGLSPSRICELFPCGVARGAYRLAGLPKPSGCV
jgi:dissimilatory sulfite reductase related protein